MNNIINLILKIISKNNIINLFKNNIIAYSKNNIITYSENNIVRVVCLI